MSGWIKFEKDLRDDVRVRRMAVALARRYHMMPSAADSDPCNACAFPGVTLVLGGLAQLWMHADSFARDDDTLDITSDEIDQLAGIDGFANVLPIDWLEILNAHSVKLPGFQEHNGTEAKRKALTAKRVTRHRDKVKLNSVATSNAPALPDQTKTRPRPDQKKTADTSRASRSTATRLPDGFSLTADRIAYAVNAGIEPGTTLEAFKDYWKAASGAKARKHDWDAAWRTWCRNQVAFSKNPQRSPAPTRDTVVWAEAKHLAKEIGYREPYPQESAGAYLTNVKLERDKAPPSAIRDKLQRGTA